MSHQVKVSADQINELKSQIEEGDNQNDAYLNEVRSLLREREPKLEQLMEVSLRKERVEQEKKDARILEILKIKDRQLGDIQEENRTQEAQYEKLGEAFQELKLRNAVLEDRELNLTHVVRQLEAKLESVTAKLD